MKKAEFLTKVCKMVAANEIKGNARELLVELAINGECRPVKPLSRSYSDSTHAIIEALKALNIPECLPSKRGNYFAEGYYMVNDAPKGGKLGNIIKINFQ